MDRPPSITLVMGPDASYWVDQKLDVTHNHCVQLEETICSPVLTACDLKMGLLIRIKSRIHWRTNRNSAAVTGNLMYFWPEVCCRKRHVTPVLWWRGCEQTASLWWRSELQNELKDSWSVGAGIEGERRKGCSKCQKPILGQNMATEKFWKMGDRFLLIIMILWRWKERGE